MYLKEWEGSCINGYDDVNKVFHGCDLKHAAMLDDES